MIYPLLQTFVFRSVEMILGAPGAGADTNWVREPKGGPATEFSTISVAETN
jgi:hypothetical protein